MPSNASKHRGDRTHGRGKKAGRGHGKRGGHGNAGLHKHKFIWTLKYDRDHFGRRGFKRPQGQVAHPSTFNISDLELHLDSLREHNLATVAAGRIVIDLRAMGVDKLLGAGIPSKKYHVKVEAASASAVEKIQSAGGMVELGEAPASETVIEE